MNTRNLIPLNRLGLKNRSNAIHQWIMVNAAYFVLLGISAASLFAFVGRSETVADVTSVKAEVSQLNRKLSLLRQQSVFLKAGLQSARELSQTPDWSILLNAIAQSLGDDVVLNQIDSIDESKVTASAGAVPKMIRLNGIGCTQQSVTGFILKLEQLNVFTQVRLLQTNPQTLRGCDSVGFELECSLTQTLEGRR